MSNNNNKGTQSKILEKYIADLRANRKPIHSFPTGVLPCMLKCF